MPGKAHRTGFQGGDGDVGIIRSLVRAFALPDRNRAHFFAISANLMRRILVDFTRSRVYQKRGGNVQKLEFDHARIPSPRRSADLVSLDDALAALAELDPLEARVMELPFRGGLSEEETGEVPGISSRTVKRDWAPAKAWLMRELRRKEVE